MTAPTPPLQARRGRKHEQVLDGARTVFLERGFEGASVDEIARAAGVSKATLYTYFPDKRILFMEVAKRECARHADRALQRIDQSCPPETVLRGAAEHMLTFLLSAFGQGVFRICVAESGRFPELGQEFYRCGPAMVRANLRDYFEHAIARGELRIDDLDLAADQFAELCKADMFPRLLMGLAREVTAAERQRVIDGAVDMFMARYGTGPR